MRGNILSRGEWERAGQLEQSAAHAMCTAGDHFPIGLCSLSPLSFEGMPSESRDFQSGGPLIDHPLNREGVLRTDFFLAVVPAHHDSPKQAVTRRDSRPPRNAISGIFLNIPIGRSELPQALPHTCVPRLSYSATSYSNTAESATPSPIERDPPSP
jgi:hypothetical protein